MCIDNRGTPASLQVGKVYQVIKPIAGDLLSDVRVIDEDGEDYLYSLDQFVPVELPLRARKAITESGPN
jgi:hypothetical protein